MVFKTALITGASSGIGKEFALQLARQRQWNLILVARGLENLLKTRDEIYDLWNHSGNTTEKKPNIPTVELEKVDLTSELERTHMIERILSNNKDVDLLINNAGFYPLEIFNSSSMEVNYRLIKLQCDAPVHLCKSVLPSMLAKKSGAIINVCSRKGLVPSPFMACYCASKSFLLNFTLSIAEEVQDQGVKVLALCPGTTITPGYAAQRPINHKRILPTQTTELVVKSTMKALDGNTHIHFVGLKNRIIFTIMRLLPMSLSVKIMGHVAKSWLDTKTTN